jgi:hypothetical protein
MILAACLCTFFNRSHLGVDAYSLMRGGKASKSGTFQAMAPDVTLVPSTGSSKGRCTERSG